MSRYLAGALIVAGALVLPATTPPPAPAAQAAGDPLPSPAERAPAVVAWEVSLGPGQTLRGLRLPHPMISTAPEADRECFLYTDTAAGAAALECVTEIFPTR